MNGPFDNRLRLTRTARIDPTVDFLFRAGAETLRDRLAIVKRSFSRGLVLGGHDSGASGQVVAPWPLDPEVLPEGNFDLIVSNLAFHWVNDLPGILRAAYERLEVGGLFLATMLADGTLDELRFSFRSAQRALGLPVTARVMPFADIKVLGDMLARAGFALPVVDSERINVNYGHPRRLVDDLRAMGENGALAQRHRRAMSKAEWTRGQEEYLAHYGNGMGGVVATFNMVTLTGWKED